MIASSSFSQVKYTVDNKTLICFTPEESACLVVKLLEAERDSLLLVKCEQENRIQLKEILLLQEKSVEADTVIAQLEKSYYNCYDNVDKYHVENDKLKKRYTIAKGLIGVLIIALFL